MSKENAPKQKRMRKRKRKRSSKAVGTVEVFLILESMGKATCTGCAQKTTMLKDGRRWATRLDSERVTNGRILI